MTTGAGAATARAFLVAILAVLVCSAVWAAPASAHDATSQSVLLVVNEQRIVATAPVPFTEVGYEDTSGDGLIDIGELRAQQAAVSSTIVEVVRRNVALRVDGQDLQIAGAGVPGLSEIGGGDSGSENVALAFVTGRPHDGDVEDVTLEWRFHSATPTVVLSHPGGVVAGELSADRTVAFTLGAWASMASFFALGIEHIRSGPDHLLFLLVLTLAVAGTTVDKSTAWRMVKLVTAFTVGHALSLGLAYFDVISLPAGLVEPAIALSIVAAAALVVVGRTDGARPWIAALIGGVHGLGFAASLASLGLATSQRAPALAAFNLGIDVAQTAVVLTIVAALWLASRVLVERMAWVRVPTAAVAAVIGLTWTATRIAAVA